MWYSSFYQLRLCWYILSRKTYQTAQRTKFGEGLVDLSYLWQNIQYQGILDFIQIQYTKVTGCISAKLFEHWYWSKEGIIVLSINCLFSYTWVESSKENGSGESETL